MERTGIYLRVMRDGAPANLELEVLTERELDLLVTENRPAVAWGWFRSLLKWVKEQQSCPRLELARSAEVAGAFVVLDPCRDLARRLLSDWGAEDYLFANESIAEVIMIAMDAGIPVEFVPLPPVV
jgi:hypothetical protein